MPSKRRSRSRKGTALIAFAGLTGTVAGVAELVKTLGGKDVAIAAGPAVPSSPRRGA